VLIITGPTAAGKTAFSLKLASHVPMEIISADSRQVYRELDIGTAKPSCEERREVPHHCIDICAPDQYFSAGEFAKLARDIIVKIRSRNRLPAVVGGSGLYIQALVDGLFEGNYRDPGKRKELRDRAHQEGWPALYHELCRVDPETAQSVHANDHKRIIRALEVYALTGRAVSHIRREETIPGQFQTVWFGLNWPRQQLFERINFRVDRMIDSGLEAEVRRLLDLGYDRSLNSLDTVGYKEMIAFLNHEIDFDEAVHRIKKNTCRFAKRQMTWFRRDSRINWLNMEPGKGMEQPIRSVMSKLQTLNFLSGCVA
jgi:tRNA dimethylallyltransferase